MFYAVQEELLLGIVGTGLMGRGIAQIAVLAGIQVRLYDSREGPGAAMGTAPSSSIKRF